MSLFRVLYRFNCLLAVLFFFTGVGFVLKWMFGTDPRKHRRHVANFTRLWAKCFCRVLNIRLKMEGNVRPSRGTLIVANHVGSPDIFVLGFCFGTFFLSKHDVANWPIVGTLARLGLTVFVDRSRKHQVKANIEDMARRLGEGDSIVLFAEGGASDGSDVLPFKTSFFEAAVISRSPVLPIAISYLDPGRPSVACWRNTTFATHFFNLLSHPQLEAEVGVLPEIPSEVGRKELAKKSRSSIQFFLQRKSIC